ncbi:hypothetical protein [Allonocardiopsis opalescens]|uniref:Uncharacterized protein n=1 Tax=Allonocardiopsis opalescens TaxID=1144618 RepID=A0A2T0QEL8_9ACTN|nr:hypothetical protein [Allonocardiopsis opalescens]PRY02301.1 hypothetical protein CLV72_101903 [Allonocardiopsis opalescens]
MTAASTSMRADTDLRTAPPARTGPGGGRPYFGAALTVGSVAAVFGALVLTGHQPGPWWAWFPLTTGLALLVTGLRLHPLPSLGAFVTGRAMLGTGAVTTVSGLLLLFGAMQGGWPAFLLVAGAVVAGLGLDRIGGRGRAAGLTHRVHLVWGTAAMALGVLFTLQYGAGVTALGALAPQQWSGLAVAAVGAHAALEGARYWSGTRTGEVALSAVFLCLGLAALVQGTALVVGIW